MTDKETRKYNNAIYDFQKIIEKSPYWGFLFLENQTFNEDETLSQEILAKFIKGQKAPKDFDDDFFFDDLMTTIITSLFVKKGITRDEAKVYLDADRINELINQAYDLEEENKEFDLDNLENF